MATKRLQNDANFPLIHLYSLIFIISLAGLETNGSQLVTD